MKRISLTVTCATVALWLWAQNSGKPAIARDAKLEAKIEKTLSNIRIQYRGGGKRVTTPYREQGTNYPEPRWAGPNLPTVSSPVTSTACIYRT